MDKGGRAHSPGVLPALVSSLSLPPPLTLKQQFEALEALWAFEAHTAFEALP